MFPDWMKPPKHIFRVVGTRAVVRGQTLTPRPPEYWEQFIPALKREMLLRKVIYWSCVGLLLVLLIYILTRL